MWTEREKTTTSKLWTATALWQEQQVIWKLSRSPCLIPSDCTTSVTLHVVEKCQWNFKDFDVKGYLLPQRKSSTTWNPRTKGYSMASLQTILSGFLHSWHFHIYEFFFLRIMKRVHFVQPIDTLMKPPPWSCLLCWLIPLTEIYNISSTDSLFSTLLQ